MLWVEQLTFCVQRHNPYTYTDDWVDFCCLHQRILVYSVNEIVHGITEICGFVLGICSDTLWVVLCVDCRNASLQSARVDHNSSVLGCSCYCLVSGNSSVWHGSWWYTVWTWWADCGGNASLPPTYLWWYVCLNCLWSLRFLCIYKPGESDDYPVHACGHWDFCVFTNLAGAMTIQCTLVVTEVSVYLQTWLEWWLSSALLVSCGSHLSQVFFSRRLPVCPCSVLCKCRVWWCCFHIFSLCVYKPVPFSSW